MYMAFGEKGRSATHESTPLWKEFQIWFVENHLDEKVICPGTKLYTQEDFKREVFRKIFVWQVTWSNTWKIAHNFASEAVRQM